MGSAASRSSGALPKLSIGQVLQRLGAEHPELTPSKIRFLEEQGLVHPARTSSGYRKFSDADVERIRTILALQRDYYLPLKVIAEHLESLDRGERPELPTPVAPRPKANGGSIFSSEAEFSREELLRRSGASRELLEQAQAASLLPRATTFTADDLNMLTALIELERSGIGPRHLRPFRTSAQHEIGLIEQALTGISRKPDSTHRHRTEAKAEELADALERVRRGLVRQSLRDRHNGR
ncbi:MerR family DNA-binding transcriptional regulator [Gulosibacter molinativorax]|uniref:MerR family DNA-binding transcriptional regulator n=1 Tax=Gulosibacter molinativorax TaxID=256821 RepID=A0ABT7C6E4_9MICO|nr:MerR family transcriptional regulator [Gulosibacter molinativorax]MDJ1370377.1 MerR family DNA-binding transcriptional regulator [Gulosibacter molinativorax]